MPHEFHWEGQLRLARPEGTVARVQPFVEADLDAIYAIESRSHANGWRRSHLSDSLQAAHHQCVGVQVDGEWAAYAIVSCIAGEAELLLLVVDKPWQGCGMGTVFLQHLCDVLAQRADTVFLEVRASNAGAIALYEKLGFNQVGVRENYYQTRHHSEDALIFARTLV